MSDEPRPTSGTPRRRRAGRTERLLVQRVASDAPEGRTPDELIVEEPMSIQLDGTLVATTMRTPGHDFELASGFCFGDGLLDGHPPLRCRYCADGSAADTEFNVVSVETGGRAPTPTPRLGTTTSSCGLCGHDAIDELVARLAPLGGDPFPVELLRRLPDLARPHQVLFERTGAVHAAAAFERDGTLAVLREDVGRHNAVDKVVGHLLLGGGATTAPGGGRALYVSGRASFELVQKAWAAGFGALVAVSAPSSLAVHTARTAGLQLAGFVRGATLNLYSP